MALIVQKKRKLELDEGERGAASPISQAGVRGAQPPAPAPALHLFGCLSIVFGFLSFGEIAHCAATCRAWHRQLYEKIACLHQTMRVISAKRVSLVTLMHSCAWKHIDTIEMYGTSTPEELYLLHLMPNLTSLHGLNMEQYRTVDEIFKFPSKLKTC